MSAYGGKPQPPQLHSYDPSRTFPESAFPYAAPIYASQPSVPASITAPVYHNAPQLTPMAYPSSQVRASFDDPAGPYLNVGPAPVPDVTNYTPQKGTRDTKFYVYITSLYELATANSPIFSLMFGNRKCQASLQKINQQGGACSYTVTCDIPQFTSTSYTTATVPVSMFMESGDGDVIAKIEVGDFIYLDSGAVSGTSTPQENSRKRKVSSESAELMKSPAKRPSSQQLRPKEEYGSYGFPQNDAAASFSSYIQPASQYTNLIPQYARPAANYQAQTTPRHLYGYPGSATTSPPNIKAQSPHIGNWNPGYATVGSTMARSPGVPSSNGSMNRPSLSSLPSPGIPANPPLIRTSTIQQTPSPATTPHGGHHGQPFNAYALYPHKAKLEIQGDLDAMAARWSDEEFESRRRLVHFRRSQAGSTITTTFSQVSVDDRPPNSVCISCIYWEEKQECFVTSVDTIYLLEQLVAARFTVEEKNRIRRNLEGFRPLTVSKGKPDSEEFFKVIMAFPAPKPRNIEKDVKVFRWKDLTSALKKIIGKYSASPSSTLPALLTPSSSTGYAAEGNSIGMSYNPGGHHHGPLSPQSISGAASSTVYSNIPARVLSPHDQRPMGLQGAQGLRVAVPGNPHEPAGHWQSSQHHMQNSQQYLSNANNRNPWDMSTYLENSPATSAGTSAPAQTLNYPAPRNGVESVAPGGDNRISRGMPSQSQQVPRS